MLSRLNIRFQNWVLGSTVGLVLGLSGIFLASVLGKFTAMSEENAAERFALIARQSTERIDSMVRERARFVTTQTRAGIGQFVSDGHLNHRDLVATFLSSLEADANLYSHYFGLGNNEFLQVVGIRRDRFITSALKAPENAHFGIWHIERKPDGSRSETWQFLDENRQPLARRETVPEYAPTRRPWFTAAMETGALTVLPPYFFASTGELGMTISIPLPDRAGVLSTNVSLRSLNAFLAQMPLSANGAILMLDQGGRVLAFHGKGPRFSGLYIPPLVANEHIAEPHLRSLAGKTAAASQIIMLGEGKHTEKYVVTRHVSEVIGGSSFLVIALAPASDFSGLIDKARRDVLLVTLGVLTLLVPLALLGSRQVSRSLAALAQDSERIKQFDFSGEPHRPDSFLYEINALGDAQAVMHHSIKLRTEALNLAREKLADLVEYGLLLSREKDRDALLKLILHGGRDIADCAEASLYLKTERDTLRFVQRTDHTAPPVTEIALFHTDGTPDERSDLTFAALHNESVVIADIGSETRFDLSALLRHGEEAGFRPVSLLTVPLSPREGEVIGLLQFTNALDPKTDEVTPFPPELIGFVQALAAQSALALENHTLLDAQKILMDSLIKIIADAIDAKSAYTGGHCKRVPELAVMLAEEVGKVETGPLAGCGFKTEDEWREFRIGAWLHDCGKVTTPEYVVDKATKLETLYNRIHEIRTRFEVLLRDAWIERLEAVESGMPASEADTRFAERKQELLDDFAFVAECNLGEEAMAPENIERLKQIGARTWLRHFDDRIGMSHEEAKRREHVPAASLPAEEPLLADQPWHVIPRTQDTAFDPKYGFRMKIPEALYNFGELYNLGIAHGTLTEEERFRINEHIVQTIVMLDQLPLPKHLRRIPEYAGTHHETLAGDGYPRRLGEDALSVPSRVMAIADIFEALTASDRPYKQAKTLSESLRIMAALKKERHIDPDLFDLFLTSGVYRRYAERFLKPEQIDEVDIGKVIG
ncbi:HD-GYP domain, c-di-GMP phosphodiesterase class II (or its inactivated variant) [Formivibrio citricus]|uniref:HD-GYP domain, c-di-GMP phosphodiesterase class II (Or its inactivated variant) n=1 Tax=Formivibrio citricus TaxID=83765 RepID=A0A1I4XSL1_9NEIS|nr:HD domain-containing phosphohydrolase [Formivibrio citricus]SFN28804.1 HD-GYP domain, c-di-GMP phosphodiesterase class II (or its inactivated variant) [Formivibrio citricus]